MTISTDFEAIAKRHKRRLTLKYVVLSAGLALVALVLGYMGLNRLTSINGQYLMAYYNNRIQIAYPNIDVNSFFYNANSQFTGELHSERTKDIDGISVPFEPYRAPYSLVLRRTDSSNEYLVSGDDGRSTYTRGTHYKMPRFFNTKAKVTESNHDKPTQDLDFIADMSGQAVEVAITFDKPYLLSDIVKLIPDQLKLNWIWIGTESSYDTSGLFPANLYGFKPDWKANMTYKEQKQLDEKINNILKKDNEADLSKLNAAYDKPVTPTVALQNSYDTFRHYLQEAVDNHWINNTYGDANGTHLSEQEDVALFLKNNRNIKTAKFAGIILTGKAEQFASLKTADWIYASNIGQSVTIQPYHQLTK
ncbi:TPA: anti sigma factor C-terminal domain-containing protein [Streptococcus equi subsp. zooepidemicus]|nr:anti sigma factor C-terminal domain-containing protein [Streptococcus equi subsp. zooepidemicus]